MKKETFFSSTTIEAKAREILASVELFRRGRDHYQFRPDHAALLVLDMQSYFLDEFSHAFIPSAMIILPNIQKLIRAFVVCGRPVIFTRHTNTPSDAGQMKRWWKDLILPDSPVSQIVPELDTMKGILIVKHQYDAFYQTELEQVLHVKGIEQVVVTGVMTHLCCETTARSAFMRGFDVFFAIDATATYTEALHRATVLNLAHGFAIPVLVEDFLAIMR